MVQSPQEKARENRARRFAARQRYTLTKSRVRDDRAWSYGRYWLVSWDTDEGQIVLGDKNMEEAGRPPGLTLGEVEDWLVKGVF